MGRSLVILVTMMYVGVCLDQVFKGAYPQAIMYFGYALANIGVLFWIR